jgi:hypothetical protein
MLILPIPYHGVTDLIPMEVVISLHCSLGVEFIEGSSEGKVEGTPKYVPTSPSMDWNAIAGGMAVDPNGQDSLNGDSL